ncbi:DUF2550 domain-containing protein [Actinoplanes utahensis]|uniref:Secreted/membrane protein n=1 Tax=Actinoplanes utahensis TaxID=1869 RepID=A0A0A6UPZ7_ACTUT|nr:DUF2550 domain-containing protein [Actinoplanes utahensis]KHD77123.1 hypothetical protein MB27_13570 [Actinoplanes utahensis]GIF33006.1 hypothetical protein Aut01nite_59920 [Actinoplanes utahensis]
MRVLEIAGICVVALIALLFAIFFRRRLLMAGGGTIRLQVRINTIVPGRGWSPGLGQFVGDELRFHKMFSLAIRPKRILDRRSLTVAERRLPSGPERLTMPGHWVVLRCRTGAVDLEIAMAETTVTGFLSWLEAGPPRDPGSLPGRQIFGPRPAES